MSAYTQARDIDITALTFGALKRPSPDGTAFTIEADVDQPTLQAAVDAAPLDNTAANAVTLRQRLQQALTANATYLGLTSPTNAQVLTQVAHLTRECNGLIRLALALLNDTTGT